MSEGPVINRKAGRSLTPNKARPSEPSPAPEPTAAPAVESAAQETPSKRSKATNSLQNNLDLQAQARVWHFNGTFSFWDNLGTWKVLIYALIAWSLYEAFWSDLVTKANKDIKGPALKLLYRLVIFGALVLFGLHWKNDVCKEKTISEWYWGSFRRNYPFLSNVFEGGVIMAASQLSLQLYKHYWAGKALAEFVFLWPDAKIMVIVSAFYVTPILTVFYKWLNEKWTLGGKWGSALFSQLVFSPVFMIFLLIFIDWTTALVNGDPLWTMPKDKTVWIIIREKFWFLNTFPQEKDSLDYDMAAYPYLSRQAINFVFWFPQTVFANFFVPPEYTLAFGAICNFAWNIIFEILVKK